jgi:hypothetical protein
MFRFFDKVINFFGNVFARVIESDFVNSLVDFGSRLALVLAILVGVSHNALAQVGAGQEPPASISLSGPRFGVTYLSDGIRDTLNNDTALDMFSPNGEFYVRSAVTQFGWQWEKGFMNNNRGLTGVQEFVLLFGGVDQGVVIPSFSYMIGLRTLKGIEFALGPNITPAGPAMAFAAGATLKAGDWNLPLNLAVVPSKTGVRVSMLAGLNMRR